MSLEFVGEFVHEFVPGHHQAYVILVWYEGQSIYNVTSMRKHEILFIFKTVIINYCIETCAARY